MRPEGGIAVVVGATGAMGRVIVDRLAARGLQVVAVARNPGELAGGLRACQADIGEDSSIDTIRACIDGSVRLGAWAAEGHDVALNSGWQAIDWLFRRDVRCRRPEGCQRSPANASAGAVCPVLPAQAGIKVAIRRRFSAAHTSFHSARTRSIPRRLNWRNPSTLLIQPLGGSAIHLRFR